jgi:biopolymer transport protein ExbD
VEREVHPSLGVVLDHRGGEPLAAGRSADKFGNLRAARLSDGRMAGAILTEGRGARRPLDFDLNMVPMIDLLMVTISFLLLTAVWTHYARLPSDALAPGASGPTPAAEEPRLHVEMNDPQRFVLHWNVGPTVIRSRDVPRHEVVTVDHGARTVRFPELAAALDDEWRDAASHRTPTDRGQDDLVLHTSDDVPYATLIGAIDAAYAVRRSCGAAPCSAFHVAFAAR